MQELNLTHLDSAKKLRLADELLASVPDQDLPIHPQLLEELERRRSEHLKNPSKALSMEEAHDRMDERVRRWRSA